MPTNSRRPFLSAIVATFDRAELLADALESLCRQTLERDAFEVVVVDDGSRDETRETAASFRARLPLRYTYQRNAGLAAARNHGIFVARGEVLLFLDDDDLADPALLEAHAETHRRQPEPELGVLGYTRLSPELAADPLMHFVTQVGCFLFSYPEIHAGDVLDFRHFWGGRSSCKRSLLLDHGVFNPIFKFGCEDVELAYRLSKHGFKVLYEPAAVSTMVRGLSFDDFCRRTERQGRANYVFSRLHPEDAVQRFTEVAGAAEAWRRIGPVYELLKRSGRELDRIARMRLESGFGVDPADATLLYGGYWAAFQASRVKGTVEKAAEIGHDLPARAALQA
jgi:glycosyltransferase involved in cell wall biosynthesis